MRAAVGTLTVADAAVIGSIKKNPAQFYANIHTAEFPGGAVRGQFHKTSPFDLRSLVLRLNNTLKANAEPPRRSRCQAARSSATLRPGEAELEADLASSATRPPGAASLPHRRHVHQAAAGANGSVVADVFGALPASFSGVAGKVHRGHATS